MVVVIEMQFLHLIIYIVLPLIVISITIGYIGGLLLTTCDEHDR